MRNDLPRGLLAAQCVHAAGESSPGNLSPGTHAVVLGTDSEGLHKLRERLEQADVPHHAIIENDPPYTDQLLAIGICPAEKGEIYKHVSSLPLLR